MTSRDPLDRPLHGVAVYNPDLLSKQELIAHFVARRSLLERLVEDLGREGATQHHLIIGQRGMGKTTLLRRLRHAVEDDPALDQQWIPLTFPEEQYNISRLSDLYLNCIDALGDALEQRGRHAEARKLDAAVAGLPDRNEPERAAQALDILLSQADKLGRRLLLLVDNLDLILDRLKQHQWGIRELLSAEKRLLLIGASSAPMEITYKYKEPFYDFFQIHELRGLTPEETAEVLLNLARLNEAVAIEKIITEEPSRIHTLHLLTGGNPRTLVLLYSVLAQGTAGDVRTDLERLLDQCTPLYKARFESLPVQAQQVVDALAIRWDPVTAGELAGTIRLEINTVSSQLNRLAQQGVVEKVAYHPSNKTGFQIAERFFNIWYLMRASRRVRRRLIWLVEFLAAKQAAKRSIELKSDSLESTHARAVVLAHRGDWAEAAPLARRFLTEGPPEFHEKSWSDILIFFSEAARTSHAADAVALLDDLALTDRYRPLREALAAIAAGTRAYLRRVAPEIRQPAERLIDELLPAGLD
ncbi:MAG: ATP-binding protein [Byssovorax sp.]